MTAPLVTAPSITADDRRNWTTAATVAGIAHIGVAALALAWVQPTEPVVPEPVVMVELPAGAEPAAAAPAATAAPAQPQQAQPQPPQDAPPFEVPPVRAPLPSNPVTVPPPAPPRPAQQAVQAAPAPTAATVSPQAAPAPRPAAGAGTDPRARQMEVDYRSLVNAYLARRKSYPVEAKKARQEGTVAIRFVVDRNGTISDVRMIRGSGHDLLDRATLDLLQRVAPLPRMPASMQRDSIPMAVAIEYSLKTS